MSIKNERESEHSQWKTFHIEAHDDEWSWNFSEENSFHFQFSFLIFSRCQQKVAVRLFSSISWLSSLFWIEEKLASWLCSCRSCSLDTQNSHLISSFDFNLGRRLSQCGRARRTLKMWCSWWNSFIVSALSRFRRFSTSLTLLPPLSFELSTFESTLAWRAFNWRSLWTELGLFPLYNHRREWKIEILMKGFGAISSLASPSLRCDDAAHFLYSTWKLKRTRIPRQNLKSHVFFKA